LGHEYPPYYFGGIGSYTKELAEYLSQHGFNVYVISGRATHKFTIERYGQLNIIRTYFPDIPIRSIWYSIFSRDIILKLAEKSNVIISNANASDMITKYLHAKSFSRKLVTVFHNTIESVEVFFRFAPYSFGTSSFDVRDLVYYALLPIYNELHKMDIEYSARLVTVAKHVRDELLSLYPSFKEKIENSNIIYAGIDYKTIKRAYLSSTTGDKDRPIYAFVGRLYMAKGVPYVLEVFKQITRDFDETAELWIFGEGPMRKYVLKYAKKHGLNIKLFGFVSRERMLKLLSKYVDVMLFPSLYEGCPIAVLEAFALGIPVVTWDLPWSQEFIIDGLVGFKVPYGDIHRFAERAIKALSLREEKRPRIHEYASKFDKETLFKGFVKIITDFSLSSS